MIFDLDTAIKHAGSKHRFQYFLLAICFFSWFSADFIAICIPIFKDEPKIFKCGPDYDHMSDCTKEQACKAKILQGQYDYWTFLEDTQLLCTQEIITFVGIALGLGLTIGAILFSKLIDVIGRRSSVLLSNFLFIFSILCLIFIKVNIYVICIWLFLIGISSTGTTICSYLLLIESIDADSRSVFGNTLNSSFAFAGFAYFALYQFTFSWKTGAFVAISVNALCALAIITVTPETPRYYLAKNQVGKCAVSVYRIACLNGRRKELLTYLSYEYKMQIHEQQDETILSLKENLVDDSKDDLSNEMKMEELFNKHNAPVEEDNFPYCNLISEPKLLPIFLTTNVLWGLSIVVYYGITFYLDEISNNMFISAYINYAAEFSSLFVTSALFQIDGYGRKTNFTIMYALAMCASVPFLFFSIDAIRNTCLFCLRFAIVSAYSNCFLYSSEVYPTEARGKGVNINNLTARVSLLTMAAFINYLKGTLIYSIWIGFSCVNFGISFLLIETKGMQLLDKVEQLE